ncbi:peptidoglycan DD-metalloendopeptidase family protein [Ruminococcaceae bacterium OttesenSCG-928-D13]|nr:peptidoglycan DD-metalloendopeptidase family protein [Ruminococcaceae bacterium OttesenSCG-928-D13]
MGKIKGRDTVKDIKVFDRAAEVSTHMKKAAVKSKSAIEAADRQAGQAQDAASPSEYAADRVSGGARDTAERAGTALRKNPVKKASENMNKARENAQEVKRQVVNIRNAVKRPDADAPKKEMIKRAKRTATRTRQAADKTIKTATKTVKGTAQTAQKGIKTAEQTAKVTVKTTQQTLKATQRAAQVAAKAARATAQAAKVAAKAAVTAAKTAAKVAVATVKAIIAALKALIAVIAAGGWVAVGIILIICLIGLLLGSIFGIFFSGEDSGTGRTMPDVVAELTTEFYSEIEEIKRENPHDVAVVDPMAINWQDVLAIYAVKVSTDPTDGMDVATLDDTKVEKLRGILRDMVSLSYSTSTETRDRIVLDGDGEETTEEVEIVILTITMTQKTADEMASQYGFTQTQQDQLHELLSPEYADLWAALVGGVVAGDGTILIGNPGFVPTGIFSWPLAEDYPVNSGFGYRADPFDPSITNFHGGVDIRCPEGTPILAAADGTVVVANATDSWGGSWGYYVKIQHDSTFHTLYAHCSRIAVTNGQQVQKGQVIAYVGSTGNSSGNHLHFEVYVGGTRVDPMDYFE